MSAVPSAVTPRAGARYYQRPPCVDRELAADMEETKDSGDHLTTSTALQESTTQHRVRREEEEGEGGLCATNSDKLRPGETRA